MLEEPVSLSIPKLPQPEAAAPPARIECVELTMSHLGLGALNEYALLVLFGNAHSHRLVEGTGHTPDGFRDAAGNALYPAYFMTSLRVPACSLLRGFTLWQHVDVGVEVQRFGDTLLESRYALGRSGELGPLADEWDAARLPTMSGNNLTVVDTIEGGGATHRQVSAPAAGRVAKLPKRRATPAGVAAVRRARTEGLPLRGTPQVALRTQEPIGYRVRPALDAAPGHAMIFAKFSEVMDHAEQQLLHQGLGPRLPLPAIEALQVTERDTYYFGNCFGGEALTIDVAGGLTLGDCNALHEPSNAVLAAELELCFEIRRASDQTLVSIARVKKLMALPVKEQDLARDVARIVSKL